MTYIQLTFIPFAVSGGGDVRVYRENFTDNGGAAYQIFHNFNLATVNNLVTVLVTNDAGQVIMPDEITMIDGISVILDLTSYTPLEGEYKVVIVG